MEENVNNVNAPEAMPQFDPEDIRANRTNAILAYFGPLVFIPMFAAKGSKFARFHANQGLVLWIFGTAAIIFACIFFFVPVLALILLYVVVCPACTVFTVLGVVNAARGKGKELPLIGKIKILK